MNQPPNMNGRRQNMPPQPNNQPPYNNMAQGNQPNMYQPQGNQLNMYQQQYNNMPQGNQPNMYPQPYNGMPPQQPQPDDPGKGMAIGSLICGIFGLIFPGLFGIGAILGIVGVVLAVVSGNKSAEVGLRRNGIAIGGLVCSIIAIVFGAGCLICSVCVGGAGICSVPFAGMSTTGMYT